MNVTLSQQFLLRVFFFNAPTAKTSRRKKSSRLLRSRKNERKSTFLLGLVVRLQSEQMDEVSFGRSNKDPTTYLLCTKINAASGRELESKANRGGRYRRTTGRHNLCVCVCRRPKHTPHTYASFHHVKRRMMTTTMARSAPKKSRVFFS